MIDAQSAAGSMRRLRAPAVTEGDQGKPCGVWSSDIPHGAVRALYDRISGRTRWLQWSDAECRQGRRLCRPRCNRVSPPYALYPFLATFCSRTDASGKSRPYISIFSVRKVLQFCRGNVRNFRIFQIGKIVVHIWAYFPRGACVFSNDGGSHDTFSKTHSAKKINTKILALNFCFLFLLLFHLCPFLATFGPLLPLCGHPAPFRPFCALFCPLK